MRRPNDPNSVSDSIRPRSHPRDDRQWHHLDAFASLDRTANDEISITNSESTTGDILWSMLDIPSLLILIGICAAILSFTLSNMIHYGNHWRMSLVGNVSDVYLWIIYTIWCLTMTMSSCLITQIVCPEAAGGGVPEMKTILSGTIKPVLLSGQLVFAKAIGLFFALIGGLSVGKEGPLIQMSGAIADLLMKLPAYRHLRRNDSKRLEILAYACAAGVTSTFGTAFSGVLFSIELTCTTYMVSNLPKAFLTTISCMFIFVSLGVIDQISLFKDVSNNNTDTSGSSTATPTSTSSSTSDIFKKDFSMIDLYIFIVFGIICGVLGVMFNAIIGVIVSFRNKYLHDPNTKIEILILRRYIMVATVTLLLAPLMYLELSVGWHGDPATLLDHIFYPSSIGGLNTTMLVYLPYKFLVTVLSVTLPLPVGLFTPVFFIGGLLGRIYG
eukprot:gene7406-15125_t